MCACMHAFMPACVCVSLGFARVENTEFYHTGQEGWTEPYDPRYSLAFVDVQSDSTTDFYSYVRDNTFHDGFSPAVGVFAVDNLEVSGNVIHHTVGKGDCRHDNPYASVVGAVS